MAYWLLDTQASRAAGKTIFRLPYPGGTWIEEKHKNERLLMLMEKAYLCASAGWRQSHDEKLSPEEEKMIDEISEYL